MSREVSLEFVRSEDDVFRGHAPEVGLDRVVIEPNRFGRLMYVHPVIQQDLLGALRVAEGIHTVGPRISDRTCESDGADYGRELFLSETVDLVAQRATGRELLLNFLPAAPAFPQEKAIFL